jgi:hypothetical protein
LVYTSTYSIDKTLPLIAFLSISENDFEVDDVTKDFIVKFSEWVKEHSTVKASDKNDGTVEYEWKMSEEQIFVVSCLLNIANMLCMKCKLKEQVFQKHIDASKYEYFASNILGKKLCNARLSTFIKKGLIEEIH